MQDLSRIVLKRGWLVFVAFVGSVASGTALAEQPDYGTMAAAIRSADYPCAHVQSVNSAGNNAWRVQCNAGRYLVTRTGDGKYSVSKAAGE